MPPKLYHPQPTHAVPMMNMQVNEHFVNNQPVGGAKAGFPPTMGQSFFSNSAAAQMGLQMGRTAVTTGQEYVEKNFGRWFSFSSLHYYFDVSNSYVVKKLMLILFPWRRRSWARVLRRSEVSGSSEGYCPPSEDVNAPDMYIPLMAFTTHILLTCALNGIRGNFHPELFGIRASKSFGIVLFEFLATRLGCYLLNISSQSQVLDMVAYNGYKFVGLILTTFARLAGSTWLTVSVFVYTYLSTAFFLLRSLKYAVLPESTMAINATITSHQRTRRIYFLFSIAALQVVYMFFLL
ncbi:COPII-coated vesicle component Hrf1 [Schizosaccharomyces japonicus yFS275]|uniref:Protein YIF1 n=1 Tax=Schizosaccharomyces japonicus (strain yFS275 / FY16936) TaxID=402676 RepID=B6JYI1_SCHJY|nr:COPII-coated vesicle component Hrf1 [Schizosaccharomyces japonicus yFS275]EEB06599.1 COPII-coated vesicle component Hrf1 [Schizosaccharomyces japonicus yFS275]